MRQVRLVVGAEQRAVAAEEQRAVAPYAALADDGAAEHGDARGGGRRGERTVARSDRRLGVLVARLVFRRRPWVERQLRQHDELGTASDGVGEHCRQLALPARRVGEHRGGKRDGQAVVGHDATLSEWRGGAQAPPSSSTSARVDVNAA